jgi:molybdate transport system substrate-binding protein
MEAFGGVPRHAPGWIVAMIGLVALALMGCGGGDSGVAGGGEPLLILAASDLQAAFVEIEDRYTETTGQRLTIVYGSTGNLAAQIEHGAPADAFFAANERFMDRLSAAGAIEEETRRVYAIGRLALVWRAGMSTPAGGADLGRPEYTTIAIANPDHAPYGMAGREALEAAGIWERVVPRLVLGENVAQTYQFVRTGNADVGIVALGLVGTPDRVPHLVVPESEHAPLTQVAAVVRGSRRVAEARRFIDYVSGGEGQEILLRYGFDPAPGT